jgi:hypothetical protein
MLHTVVRVWRPSLKNYMRATVDLDVDLHLGILEGVRRSHSGNPVWVMTGVTHSTTCMCGTTG